MALTKYIPVSRFPKEKIVLRNNQFARWMSKRNGVSHAALSKAIQLITSGLLEALANGYNINLAGLGRFETREMPPRVRYHRLHGERYISQPSTVVHFRKSDILTKRVRELAAANLEDMVKTPAVKPITK